LIAKYGGFWPKGDNADLVVGLLNIVPFVKLFVDVPLFLQKGTPSLFDIYKLLGFLSFQ